MTYTYDALYRLSTALTTGSASYPQWGLSWAYDRYGNRLSQSVTAGSAPANSLSFANPGGAQTNRPDGYGFDANGNMTSEPAPTSYTYQYDAENRLVNFMNSAATYTYDGNGLRVKKVSGSTTVYIFSGSKVVAEYDNGAAVGAPSREYIYSEGALLAKIEAGATTYFQPDHLSNRVLTDSGGNSSGQRGHYPYGDIWYESGTLTKLKFTSYERDNESTNDYALARFHISRFGRFLTPDPIAGSISDPQSLNRFAYVRNDPIDLVDPLGLLYMICQLQADGSTPAGLNCATIATADFYAFRSGSPDLRFDGNNIYAGGNLIGTYLWIPDPPTDRSVNSPSDNSRSGGGRDRAARAGNSSGPWIPTPAEAATKFCEDHGQIASTIRGTNIPITASLSATAVAANYNTKNEITPVIPAIPWPEWLNFGAGIDIGINVPQGSAPSWSIGLGRNLGISFYPNAQGKTTGINLNIGLSMGPPVTVSPGSANVCGKRAGG